MNRSIGMRRLGRILRFSRGFAAISSSLARSTLGSSAPAISRAGPSSIISARSARSHFSPVKSQRTHMARSRYIVGIDLGTTNCAVAYVDTKGKERPSADVRTFEVPQLVAAGESAPRPMLPSFLYLPGPARASRRGDPAPLARRLRPDRRRVRPGPGGEGAQSPRRQRQELALPPGGRPRGRDPSLGCSRPRPASCRRSRRRRTTWPTSATPGTPKFAATGPHLSPRSIRK